MTLLYNPQRMTGLTFVLLQPIDRAINTANVCIIIRFLLHSTLYIKPTCCEKWQSMWAFRSLVIFILWLCQKSCSRLKKERNNKITKLTCAGAENPGQEGIWCSIFPTTSTIIECPRFPIGNSECHLLQVSGNETVTKLCITFHKDFRACINLNALETFSNLLKINWKRWPGPEGPRG